MPSWLVFVLGVAVIGAIFATTPAGRRLRGRLPVASLRAGRASKQDRQYLLRVCHGDAERVARLLDLARTHNPEMTEAEAYRRAIRAHLRDKR
jgi:hypothetical protein